MSTWALAAIAAVFLAVAMTVAWAIVQRGGKSGWIDAIWSLAVGATGVFVALAPVEGWDADPTRRVVVAAVAAAWSLRLGLHIVSRTMKGGDDPRYTQLKKEWGDSASSRLLMFLQIQAACGLVLAGAIFLAAHNPAPGLGPADWLGLALFAVAVGGEAVADAQLSRFRADPANKGRICDIGLWGLSRHPNYFFEWLGWLGYAVIAIDVSGAYPWGWAALSGPVLMYWLLVHASGIPPLEAHMLRSRGDAFRDYQRRVNAFFPGPSRSGPASAEERTG